MRQSFIVCLVVLVSNVYTAPQFISFADGKLGVNFGGYHAGVGVGGGGAGGGLFAEAGTPHGQAAMAGLGGSVDNRFGPTGGLFAGATAGGNVKASAGLSGKVDDEKAAGNGYAHAQAADKFASAGMGGESGIHGSGGFSFSSSKSFGAPTTIVKDTNVEVQPIQPFQTKVHKKVHTKLIEDAPLPLATVEKEKEVNEVYVPAPPPTKVIEKTYVHTHVRKPHRHHLRKTAYIGGYLGGDVAPPHVYVKPVHSTIEKRIDLGAEGEVAGDVHTSGVGQVGYKKEVTFQRNPTFFADIFNIPISTLKAVGNFLGNTAGSTNVSVQKSATFEKDALSPKHGGSSSSSNTHVSVEAPTASKIIDDIFAIPINTLGAVNKFLENNVPARKRVQVTEDGTVEQERVRVGPHGRRRANKQIVVYQNVDAKPEDSQ